MVWLSVLIVIQCFVLAYNSPVKTKRCLKQKATIGIKIKLTRPFCLTCSRRFNHTTGPGQH